MSIKKHGGIWFVRVARITITISVKRGARRQSLVSRALRGLAIGSYSQE